LIAPSTNQQIQTAIAPNLNQKAITEISILSSHKRPRISDLINGDIERFSIDKLVMMLVRAGMDVRFEVS